MGSSREHEVSRRQALRTGLVGAAAFLGGGGTVYLLAGPKTHSRERAQLTPVNAGPPPNAPSPSQPTATSDPAPVAKTKPSQRGNPTEFPGDAPKGELWERWQERGWAREARYVEPAGSNVLCQLCPHECLLEPESRGRCRTRVNKGGKVYTLAYGNPCSLNVDPIEKKPLYHYLPDVKAFSLATAGCQFRCLNCQNWEISQRRPEETKNPRGEAIRMTAGRRYSRAEFERLSAFPDDVVALAEATGCRTVAYTYSEPNAYYDYMLDTAKRARAKGLKNLSITCGYIRETPLVELCRYLDAANVNLKSFSEKTYRALNAGSLQPILNTLQTMKKNDVWIEVTNLIVPTYTDKLEEIERMCGWIVEKLGPDQVLHFLRFRPLHKLAQLPATPTQTLVNAREVARRAGLRYVYIGGAPEIKDACTTFCPKCDKPVIERRYMTVTARHMKGECCAGCKTKIAGVFK
jgi:pyruvate formate lyase activating enzyme